MQGKLTNAGKLMRVNEKGFYEKPFINDKEGATFFAFLRQMFSFGADSLLHSLQPCTATPTPTSNSICVSCTYRLNPNPHDTDRTLGDSNP